MYELIEVSVLMFEGPTHSRVFGNVMELEPPLLKKYVNMKFQRVKVDASFVPDLEDDAIEVQHLLAEPKNDPISVDGVFCFDKENLDKRAEVGDDPCKFACGPGGLDDSNTAQEGNEDLSRGVSDGMLPEVDDVGDLYPINGLSTACEDYLLDAEFTEVTDLEISSSESDSPEFSGSDNVTVGISKSTSISLPKCHSDLLDKTDICKLHGAFRRKCGCQTGVKDKKQLNSHTLLDSPTLGKSENGSNLLARGVSSNESNKDMVCSSGLTYGRRPSALKVQYNEFSPVGKGVKRVKFVGHPSRKSSFEASRVGSNLLASGVSSIKTEKDMISVPSLTSGRRSSTSNVLYNEFSPVGKGVKRVKFSGHPSRKSSVEVGKVGILAQKRSRKPTKRYIEESSKDSKAKQKSLTTSKDELLEVRSHNLQAKQKSLITSKDKLLEVRSHNKHHHVESKRLKSVPKESSFRGASSQAPLESRARKGCSKIKEEPFDEANSQVPLEFRAQRGYKKREESFGGTSSRTPMESRAQRDCSKKQASSSAGKNFTHYSSSVTESEEDSSPEESDDDFVSTSSEKGVDRRKNQKMWTLAEVIKLVDGVSHHGVGRWTDIKRHLFSSSSYRTPIDLRDKWRNLLRTSSADLHSDSEDEEKQKDACEKKGKNAARLLPKTVLQRVSELASIHPYPRANGSHLPRSRPLTSSKRRAR